MTTNDETQQELSHDDLVTMAATYVNMSPYEEYAHQIITATVLADNAISDKYRSDLLRYLLKKHTLAELSVSELRQIAHFLDFAECELSADYVRLVMKLKQYKQDQA